MVNATNNDLDFLDDCPEEISEKRRIQIGSEYENLISQDTSKAELQKLVEDLQKANKQLVEQLIAERKKPFVEYWGRESELRMFNECLHDDIDRLHYEIRTISLTRDSYLLDLAKCIKDLNYWKGKAITLSQNNQGENQNAQT